MSVRHTYICLAKVESLLPTCQIAPAAAGTAIAALRPSMLSKLPEKLWA